ncbi:MAG: TolB-like 6-bladed beta-propeller domain-containing protein [Prevotellaceae bacterium]|jgi:hypothetical protein|nr:TolB-like 6-bladed beta-propeller domain-containing protein [Prevotellaceae bacterium]
MTPQESNKLVWWGYYDKNDSLLATLSFPNFPETADYSPIEKSLTYSNPTFIAVKPDRTKIVCVTANAGVLSIAECTPDTLIERIQIRYVAPDLIRDQQVIIVHKREAPVQFCDVACDNNRIYVWYSGRSMKDSDMKSHHCHHLLVYDWQGNPIRRFYLEKALYAMGYDEKRKVIYGIAYDPEGCLVEYNLH